MMQIIKTIWRKGVLQKDKITEGAISQCKNISVTRFVGQTSVNISKSVKISDTRFVGLTNINIKSSTAIL